MINRLKTIVLETADRLTKQQVKLVTAESCTGGGLSYWLTSVPGSSNWFERGFVTYSNAAKCEMLGVRERTLSAHGAVSSETANEMAVGALRESDADLSIAITGIAGPDGGSEEKPVGTVWVGIAGKQFETQVEHYVFSGDRQEIRLKAMIAALEKLREIG